MQEQISTFIRAMKYGGITIEYEQVAQGLNITDKREDGTPLVDRSGKPYIVAVYTIPEGQRLPGTYPLMMAEKDETGKWAWKKASRGGLGKKKEIPIGVYAIPWKAMQDKEYAEVLVEDTNHFQIDDLGIWSVFEPEEGKINQREFDKLLWGAGLAKRNGYTLSGGSGMIWGHPDWGVPTWLKSKKCSQEELLAIAEAHIEKSLTPFGNDLRRVSVANEMLRHPLYIPNFWTETRGIDRNTLLKRSFRKARQVVPQAELALREFSMEFAGYPRSEEFYNLVMQLNDEEMTTNHRKLIDAVEFQLPLLLDALIGKDPAMAPSNFTDKDKRKQMMEKLRNNIRRFKKAGVNVYIVELMLPIDRLTGSSIEEKLIHQAEIYFDIYGVCVQEGIGIGLTRTNTLPN